jgi:hypothetical protein
MADNDQQREPAPPRPRSWDYDRDPLKAGGMQVAVVVVGFGIVLALIGLFGLLWYFLS